MEEIIKINDEIVDIHTLQKEIEEQPDVNIFSTGYKYLDECINGVREGDFIAIAGKPKSGKSQFAISLTKNFTELGNKCLWIQAELSYKEFIKRFGKEPPLLYVPRELKMPTITWIEGRIKEAVEKYGVRVVFIDDIGLIADEEMYGKRNAFEIYGIRMTRLKRVAVRNKIAIFTIAHIDKDSAKKGKTKSGSNMDASDIKGTMDMWYRVDSMIGIQRGQPKSEITIQDRNPGDSLFMDTDCYVYILASRHTGIQNTRIKCRMDVDGFIKEYE